MERLRRERCDFRDPITLRANLSSAFLEAVFPDHSQGLVVNAAVFQNISRSLQDSWIPVGLGGWKASKVYSETWAAG